MEKIIFSDTDDYDTEYILQNSYWTNLDDKSLHYYHLSDNYEVMYYKNGKSVIVEDDISNLSRLVPLLLQIDNLHIFNALHTIKFFPNLRIKSTKFKEDEYITYCKEKDSLIIHNNLGEYDIRNAENLLDTLKMLVDNNFSYYIVE